MNDENMTQINVRLTKQDLEKIDRNAKEAGMSRAAFVRLAAINSRVKVEHGSN